MLDRLRIFVACAEHGSMSAAGRHLDMAPSSVSRQLGQLETELGAKLLERSTRALRLTAAGETFYHQAKQLLRDWQAACAAVREPDREPAGRLRISALESFGRLYVCPMLPAFLDRYPQLQVEIELDNQVADLYRHRVDVAVRIGRPADSRLIARPLVDNEMLLCAAPAYLQAHPAPRTPEDLRHHACLTINRHRQTQCWYFRRGAELRKIYVQGPLCSSGGTPLLLAALQGAGIVLLPRWMAGEPLRRGALQGLLPDWTPQLYTEGSGGVYAVYLQGAHGHERIRAWVQFFIDYWQPHWPAAPAAPPSPYAAGPAAPSASRASSGRSRD